MREPPAAIELRFRNILGIVFREFSAFSKTHLAAYDRLLDLGNATALALDLLAVARRDTPCMRHFRIFLDDAGTYDIIACDVETP